MSILEQKKVIYCSNSPNYTKLKLKSANSVKIGLANSVKIGSANSVRIGSANSIQISSANSVKICSANSGKIVYTRELQDTFQKYQLVNIKF